MNNHQSSPGFLAGSVFLIMKGYLVSFPLISPENSFFYQLEKLRQNLQKDFYHCFRKTIRFLGLKHQSPPLSLTILNMLYQVLYSARFLPSQIYLLILNFWRSHVVTFRSIGELLTYSHLSNVWLGCFLNSVFCLFKEAFKSSSSLTTTSICAFFTGAFVRSFEANTPTAPYSHF